MLDSRTEILKQLKVLLDPIGLPVYSVVPDNEPNPFIFIGGIESQQTQNKGLFETTGTAMIELYTGTREWIGSLDIPLGYLRAIKISLQPYRRFVLDLSGMSMVYWVLFNDTGLFTISTDKKYYNAVIQYEYEIVSEPTYIDRVEADGGVVEAWECVLKELI